MRALLAMATLALAIGATLEVLGAPTEEAKLTAAGSFYFGSSVAVEGDTAVMGSYAQGAAWVFTRTGTTWTLQANLTASEGVAGDQFGGSVAVEGDTAVVGAYQDETAYVFTRTGTTWTQQARLTASDAGGTNRFGVSVAIAGSTVVVGAYGNTSGRGAAYVFTRTGPTWTQQAKLTAADAADFDNLGYSVALAGDTAVAGAIGKDISQGAAYVFTRAGTTWTQQARITAADAAGSDDFGVSVAIEGDTAVVGADTKNSYRGAAYVFTRSGTTWTEQAKLTPADAANGDWFGVSVGLAGDTVVAGAYAKNSAQGAAYVFTRTGTAWAQDAKLTASDAANSNYFGQSVALAGGTAVVGAYANNASQGAVYVFGVGAVAPPPITSFFLPKKVTAKVNASATGRSTLVASGIFDTGPDAPDFASAATLDVGGLHFDIPGLTPVGKGFAFAGNGVSFSIAPNPYGSSRAKFKLKFTGDLTGKVAMNGPLDLYFDNAITDGGGTVELDGGAFGLGKVSGSLIQPNLFVVRAHATFKGPGKDSFTVIVGLATGGTTPPAAADLTVGFGSSVSATIPGASFVRKGATDTFTGNQGGITKVVVDYAREQIAITAKGLDLSAFTPGGNSVLISVGVGGDQRAVLVRMGRIGNLMKY